jgi:hypothetical protein
LGRALVETDDGALWIGVFRVEIEHIFHAGDVFAVDLRNAPHVLAPGLKVVFGQAPAHGLAGDAVVLGEPDQLTRQQHQRPTGAARGRLGTGRCHQQGFLFARELTARSRARLFAERRRQIAEHEAALGPVDGRAADAHAPRDRLVAGPGVGRQQNLRSLELACRVLAAAQKCRKFGALGLAELDPIAYVHPCLLLVRGKDEQLNRMAGLSRSAKAFTPKQGQYLAFIHLYTRLHRRPPAETDMQQYFRVSPPSVHQMVLTLEREGFIRRQPRIARSIELLVDPEHLPELL